MPRGGRREGAGRKPGSKVTKTQLIAAEALAAGVSPLEYMLAVMRDPAAPADRRDRMAAAAAPYIHPRLAVSAVSVHERKFSDMTEEERKREIERLLAQARQVIAKAKAGERLIDPEATETNEKAPNLPATAGAGGR
jgi:hypothetical protein